MPLTTTPASHYVQPRMPLGSTPAYHWYQTSHATGLNSALSLSKTPSSHMENPPNANGYNPEMDITPAYHSHDCLCFPDFYGNPGSLFRSKDSGRSWAALSSAGQVRRSTAGQETHKHGITRAALESPTNLSQNWQQCSGSHYIVKVFHLQ